LDRLRFKLFAALIIGLLSTHAAGAQTATNITVVSGNGQVTCPLCVSPQRNPLIQPYIVKVTDASGKPVANQEVDWALSSIGASFDSISQNQSFTDANGVTQIRAFEIGQGGISTGYFQSQTTATLPTNGASVTFYHTQSTTDVSNHSNALIGATQVSPGQFDPPLTGVAGATGATPIRVRVDSLGQGVPNVSIRLLQEDATNPGTISCPTAAGADPGSILTDSNGEVVCNPIFGGNGPGAFNVLVGGVTADTVFNADGKPIGFRELFANQFVVTPSVAGAITVVSGNNQNVNPGQATSPMVVKVTDASGSAAISGATVVWSVTPAGAVTFAPTSSSTDTLGQASTVATLAPNAAGAISIKAALTGSLSNLTTSFTVNANVTLTGLQKVSGDTQTAAAGQPFGQPLVVQVNGSTGQPLANFPVAFSITGPGNLSATSVSTNSAGRAQVTVTAGSTQGNVTVTAQAGSFSQAFALTVIPPGPSLTANSFVNGADFQRGSISPCSVATIIASGIAPNVQGVVTPGAIIGPLPYLLANVKVSFNNSQAPIYNVANVNGQQQVTVQVPCDVTPGNSVPVTVTVAGGNASVNVPVLPASPGVFLTTMSDGRQRAVAVRPDGSFVSIENPARRGEIIRAYTTGLGPVSPSIGANSIPVPGTDSNVLGQVIVGVNNAGTRLVSARLAPNLIGVYEVAFEVPSDAPAGNNVIFSVGVNVTNDSQTRFSAGTSLPIQ